MLGDRLSALVSFEGLKLAAGLVILSPFIPLLFMGEEYGETAPFPYFVSHSDPYLIEATRQGRQQEFAAFRWEGGSPDPQDETTFLSAKLNHDLRDEGKHRVLLKFYRELLGLRKTLRKAAGMSRERRDAVGFERHKAVFLRWWASEGQAAAIFHFGDSPTRISVPLPSGDWTTLMDSAEEKWAGPGSAIPETVTSDGEESLMLASQSFVILMRVEEHYPM